MTSSAKLQYQQKYSVTLVTFLTTTVHSVGSLFFSDKEFRAKKSTILPTQVRTKSKRVYFPYRRHPKIIPLSVPVNQSWFRKSQVGLEIANPVTRILRT